MKSKPDICELYQRKFIVNTPPKIAYTLPLPFNDQILDKYGRFSQRLYNLKEKTSIKCVKITKQNRGSQVIKQKAYSLNLKDHWNQVTARKKQVHQPQQRQSELLRQMMKLSPQQLGDLQISVGGENKLLKTLKSFFERRNKIRQQEKAKMAKSDFKPVRSNIQRYSHRVIYSREKQKDNRSWLVSSMEKQGEKELAPWQIGQPQGQ